MAKVAGFKPVIETGTAAAPGLSLLEFPGSGLYGSGSGGIGIAVNGVQVGSLTPSITNDNAPTGGVGEYQQASRIRTNNTGVTSTVTLNVLSAPLSLTAGDWELSATVCLIPAATTSITIVKYGIATTSATMPASNDVIGVPTSNQVIGQYSTAATVPGANDMTFAMPSCRVSLAATTSIYLVANCTFSVSTLGIYGGITARRVR